MNKLTSPRIAGAGLLALDVVIPKAGSTSAKTFAGGTCGNVLSILSYFGWHASPIGAIGNDIAGERLLADLRQWHLALDRVIIDQSVRTPVFVQTLERDAQGLPRHRFATECPTCGGPVNSTGPAEIPVFEFGEDKTPHFFFMDRLSPSILNMAGVAKRHGAMVMYEPSVETDRRFWGDALQLVDVLKYSEDRFRPEDFETYSRTPRLLWEIQTHGARGLRFRQHGGTCEDLEWTLLDAIAAPRLVDTCGAGDWCTAGLLFAVAAEKPSLRHSLHDRKAFSSTLRMGQAFAAWACGFEGARGAMYASAENETRRVVMALLAGHSPSPSSGDENLMGERKRLDTFNVCDAAHGRRQTGPK